MGSPAVYSSPISLWSPVCSDLLRLPLDLLPQQMEIEQDAPRSLRLGNRNISLALAKKILPHNFLTRKLKNNSDNWTKLNDFASASVNHFAIINSQTHERCLFNCFFFEWGLLSRQLVMLNCGWRYIRINENGKNRQQTYSPVSFSSRLSSYSECPLLVLRYLFLLPRIFLILTKTTSHQQRLMPHPLIAIEWDGSESLRQSVMMMVITDHFYQYAYNITLPMITQTNSPQRS